MGLQFGGHGCWVLLCNPIPPTGGRPFPTEPCSKVAKCSPPPGGGPFSTEPSIEQPPGEGGTPKSRTKPPGEGGTPKSRTRPESVQPQASSPPMSPYKQIGVPHRGCDRFRTTCDTTSSLLYPPTNHNEPLRLTIIRTTITNHYHTVLAATDHY